MEIKETMYYAMSIPEVAVLLFVLFLWMLAVFFFIKRYKKISTIERAGLYYHNIGELNKVKSKHETISTSDSISLQEKNKYIMNTNIPSNSNNNNNNNTNKSAISIDLYNDLFNSNSNTINENAKQLINRNKNEPLHYRHASCIQDYDNTKLNATYIQRSCSEPAFNELIPNISTSAQTDLEPLICMSAMDHKQDTLYESQINSNKTSFIDNFNLYSKRLSEIMNYKPIFTSTNSSTYIPSTSKTPSRPRLYSTIDQRRATLKKQTTLINEVLLDPNRIPKLIRKSLIDLHKKSVWNLSKVQNQNDNLVLNTKKMLKNRNSEHFV